MLSTLLYGIWERRCFITTLDETGIGKTTLLNTVQGSKVDSIKKPRWLGSHPYKVLTHDQLLEIALADPRLANSEETGS